MAGEQKMRSVSAELVGENLEAETVPLTFRLKDGGEEIRPAPIAYAPNLWMKVEDMLNNSDDSSRGYATSEQLDRIVIIMLVDLIYCLQNSPGYMA